MREVLLSERAVGHKLSLGLSDDEERDVVLASEPEGIARVPAAAEEQRPATSSLREAEKLPDGRDPDEEG